VERAFRDQKDPAVVQFSPMYHWTDSKIRVHAFTCVLALTLVGLVHRRVVQAGLDISRSRLLEELKSIREVINVYTPVGGRGKPRTETVLSQRTPLQQQLCTILDLAPKSGR
jgi:transposase